MFAPSYSLCTAEIWAGEVFDINAHCTYHRKFGVSHKGNDFDMDVNCVLLLLLLLVISRSLKEVC